MSSHAKFDLMTLTVLMKVGSQLQGISRELTLTEDDKQLLFDRTVRTPKGRLFVIRIITATSEDIATPSNDVSWKRAINNQEEQENYKED